MDAFDDLPREDDGKIEDVADHLAQVNERNQRIVADRRAEEEARFQELKAKAEDDRNGFTNNRTDKIAIRMDTNRSEEQTLYENLEADLDSSNPWERVGKMTELRESDLKNSTDMRRMRQLLIQLKNEKGEEEIKEM